MLLSKLQHEFYLNNFIDIFLRLLCDIRLSPSFLNPRSSRSSSHRLQTILERTTAVYLEDEDNHDHHVSQV